MAFFNCYFKSAVLEQEACFNAIIPDSAGDNNIKTLYLLHGLSDNHTNWTRFTCIERYANEAGIAVIMPNVDRSFYTDMKYGRDYYTFISEELINYTRRIFKLSDKREDTFIAGLSMGGYGAYKIALRNPDKFCAAASLSGVLDISSHNDPNQWKKDRFLTFGEVNTLEDCEESVLYLVRNFKGENKPRLYQACGTEDFLYQDNQTFREVVKDKGFDHFYEEGPGSHSWKFWNEYIEKAIKFFMEG